MKLPWEDQPHYYFADLSDSVILADHNIIYRVIQRLERRENGEWIRLPSLKILEDKNYRVYNAFFETDGRKSLDLVIIKDNPRIIKQARSLNLIIG
ncbi:MAG: hypothetical protein Q8Q35_02775 [Nanoarchaeota archaeon]|nr:hypothetical protein [Nanoarchaeota archaeon]